MRASVLVLAMATTGLAVPTAATVTLSPAHGRSGESFTATYSGPREGDRCLVIGSASFTWDGQRVGAVPLTGCQASLRITPPAGQDGLGNHLVAASATDPSGVSFPARATYTVDPAPVEPSKTPRPGTPSPRPQRTTPPVTVSPAAPSTSPAPIDSPSPSYPSPDVSPLCEPDPEGAPAGVLWPPGLSVVRLAPASALPPALGLEETPAVTVTVRASPAVHELKGALPCVRLNLGPGNGYQFVNYAFRSVAVATVRFGRFDDDVELQVRLELTFASVAWRYRSGGVRVTGNVVPAPKAGGGRPALLWGVGGAVMFGSAAALWAWRRRQSG